MKTKILRIQKEEKDYQDKYENYKLGSSFYKLKYNRSLFFLSRSNKENEKRRKIKN